MSEDNLENESETPEEKTAFEKAEEILTGNGPRGRGVDMRSVVNTQRDPQAAAINEQTKVLRAIGVVLLEIAKKP